VVLRLIPSASFNFVGVIVKMYWRNSICNSTTIPMRRLKTCRNKPVNHPPIRVRLRRVREIRKIHNDLEVQYGAQNACPRVIKI
jgi:hypothetical protein